MPGAGWRFDKGNIMPELPEVEVIARGLRDTLVGRRVTAVRVFDERAVPGHTPEEFEQRVCGVDLCGVGRRGKLLLLDIRSSVEEGHTSAEGISEGRAAASGSGMSVLTVHLRMTGRMVHGPAREAETHERIRFCLDDGSVLTFADVRRFGGCRVFTRNELERWSFWQSLGPEPLEVSTESFVERLQSRRARIKGLLLDQRVIAGIGNIYADESLFRAGIRPDALAAGLSAERLAGLHASLREVLTQAIAENGSSISDYRTARGDAGAFQNSFQVYGRTGKTCLRCGALLCGCKVAGRSTCYCPDCQTD